MSASHNWQPDAPSSPTATPGPLLVNSNMSFSMKFSFLPHVTKIAFLGNDPMKAQDAAASQEADLTPMSTLSPQAHGEPSLCKREWTVTANSTRTGQGRLGAAGTYQGWALGLGRASSRCSGLPARAQVLSFLPEEKGTGRIKGITTHIWPPLLGSIR